MEVKLEVARPNLQVITEESNDDSLGQIPVPIETPKLNETQEPTFLVETSNINLIESDKDFEEKILVGNEFDGKSLVEDECDGKNFAEKQFYEKDRESQMINHR